MEPVAQKILKRNQWIDPSQMFGMEIKLKTRNYQLKLKRTQKQIKKVLHTKAIWNVELS